MVVYGAIILSFLGGIRWGTAIGPYDAGRQAPEFAASVMGSLAGLSAAFLPAIPALAFLIVWSIVAPPLVLQSVLATDAAASLPAFGFQRESMLAEARAIDRAAARYPDVQVALAPPFTLIGALREAVTAMGVGGQDCHTQASGAFTGDVSAVMLADAGAGFVIVGHSERRALHG